MDSNPHLPKFQQIMEYIKRKISTGEWTVGSKIPSQRVLAKTFGVNRSTVITALEELMADGLIEGKMGMGTVVVNNTWTLMATTPPPDWNEYVKSGLYQPSTSTVQEINKDENDTNLIQLSKGELSPDIFPLESMKDVMKRVTENLGVLGYEEPKGYFPLRKAISGYLKTFGMDTSPSSILIVSGALQALQLISVGLLPKGSNVFLENPSYLYSLHVFQSTGMKLTRLKMDKEGLLPYSLSKEKRRDNESILYSIPCFQNPTGILMTEKRRKEIMNVCEAERLPIIEDDIYRELWLDEPPPPPLKGMDKNGQVLYLGSLSKTLSPGLRIGWLVGPETVIERLSDIKMQTDYGSSSISQRIATEWLDSGLYTQHLATVREELRARRKAIIQALETYASDIATWEVPKGGFYIWLKLHSKVSMKELFTKTLEKGILINPGKIYGEESDKYIRLSYSYVSLQELQKGIFELSNIIRSLF
ncbi:PLP-dependent aminotransferase family protein [Neobacillus drentensis]|uniref:MocR-like pyridoxine biosynthesis transcription factor PdxR n=1 Tax=Neobacillus drentensis TaxID=220684 RepID=UPI002FFE171A